MPQQPQLLNFEPEEPLSDEEKVQKAEYHQRLADKLKDPQFREIEGFPIGEDEAILALSDPPYYTACPNPFLVEIIETWQNDRDESRKKLGFSEDIDGNGYHREPFAADVSEGKSNSIYNTHTYHTKVPHPAIMRYILQYTDPGDIIFDGFCGTGMSGIASQLCGDRTEVEKLGYYVDSDGLIFKSPGDDEPISRLGIRKAILNDLSPAATFIANNYNSPFNPKVFEHESFQILDQVEKECGWMYETWHPHSDHPNRKKCRINFTVFSDVFVCNECGSESAFWEIAVDHETGYRKKKAEPLMCPYCGMEVPLSGWERAWTSEYDTVNNDVRNIPKRVPVRINYSNGKTKIEKKPDHEDFKILEEIEKEIIPYWYPTARMPLGDESRRNDNIGITHVHHFYTKRNLMSWSSLRNLIDQESPEIRLRLLSWIQSVTLGHTLLNRFLAASYSQVNRYLKGTLYIAPFISEISPWYSLTGRIRAMRKLNFAKYGNVLIETSSITSTKTPDNSIDYIFIDPPFGANISYSDLNFIWEAWMGVITNNNQEAVVSKAQEKSLTDYKELMTNSFEQCYRILKPGRWMTVEFHNSKNSVWNAIQESMLRAGFIVADVRTLDKKQMSMQQMTSASAVKQDLVISAYKPVSNFEELFSNEAESSETVWAFVRQHLNQLPVVVTSAGKVEILNERQNYLLFDRMVAFYIEHGRPVPISSSEFYSGLNKRYPKRDGMFFLPDQVVKYDRARLNNNKESQLTLFVNDEKSAIQWLRQVLDSEVGGGPKTYKDIQPQFLQQLQQARHEKLPELLEILEQNFLQDKNDRWYLPDFNKASDLEKIRNKALLREFNIYLEGKKKLKQFRTEAIRAGFADAWQRKDFATIVQVAERLPESIIQEDPDLLMYYDNASLRVN